jgi:hypothetical protein
MPKPKKQKKLPKIKYIESSASDQEKQERLDKAFDILFEETLKNSKK